MLALASLGTVHGLRRAVAQTLPVRVERWLEIRSLSGTVQFTRYTATQPARVGYRLQSVGEGLRTGYQSSAMLALDTEVGFVMLSENTDIQVRQLTATADGGRITELNIQRGQVRLQTRPFTNPGTRLEIHTPAGVSSVRGTVYGLAVQPSGRTGVATETGAVTLTAAGESVTVNANFQSLMVPGEPPTPPQPLTNDPRLDLRSLRPLGANQVQIQGNIDPLNILIIQDQVQTVDREGHFVLELPLPETRQLRATVVTPLGKQQIYELRVP